MTGRPSIPRLSSGVQRKVSSAFGDRLALKVLAVLLAVVLWFLISGRERLENRRSAVTPRREVAPAAPILPAPRSPVPGGSNGGGAATP